MRHSFGMPHHSIRLFWHWPTHCHSQLGLGVILWHPSHLSLRDHIGVLLQMHKINTLVPHFFSRLWGTRIVVTPETVSEVLHIPRVAHPDYPSCEHLRTVSKDELSSRFCETPLFWADVKTPLAQALQKVRGSLTWWWHSFFIHCLTITLLQSLVLDFCYPF